MRWSRASRRGTRSAPAGPRRPGSAAPRTAQESSDRGALPAAHELAAAGDAVLAVGGHGVAAGPAVDGVARAVPRADRVCARPAEEPVRARAAVEDVVAGTALEPVVAGAAGQPVVPAPAE